MRAMTWPLVTWSPTFDMVAHVHLEGAVMGHEEDGAVLCLNLHGEAVASVFLGHGDGAVHGCVNGCTVMVTVPSMGA